ncbi:MAG: VWA domain-containing protein [Treponema sp.]|nr:VWA domain-containing protein [Treponema sp.]
MKTRFTIVFALAASLAGALYAQTSLDPVDAARRDVFVILDVSGSMEEQNKFPNVQAYLEGEVVNGLLKTGDHFTLITFGDSAQETLSKSITSEADRTALRDELYALKPDNDFTDIGTAMEKLVEVLEKTEESSVRRVILFITDGLNAPPPGSRYRGVNLSLDDRFRELGEKVSQSGWFLYVIGIGGETDAQVIATAVPGAVYHTTDTDLSGVDINAMVDEMDAGERAAAEAARLQNERAQGVLGFLRSLAAKLGISLGALFIGFLVLLLLFILLVLLIASIFKTKDFIITDEQETLVKSIPAFAGITLNSAAGVLPAVGGENDQILRVQRGAFGVKIKTLEPAAIGDGSPYKKGTRPLRGVIMLANGRLIRITRR